MYFKIENSSETFKSLIQLKKRNKECHLAACALATELGGNEKGSYIGLNSMYNLSGGISGIMMEEKKPGWVNVYKKTYNNCYFPQKNLSANKEVLEKINSLPTTSLDDLNKIVNFEEQSVGRHHYTNPIIHWNDDACIMQIHDRCKYTPVNGVVEILGSEYEKLLHIINPKSKEM
jgi:hypothetical protein